MRKAPGKWAYFSDDPLGSIPGSPGITILKKRKGFEKGKIPISDARRGRRS